MTFVHSDKDSCHHLFICHYTINILKNPSRCRQQDKINENQACIHFWYQIQVKGKIKMNLFLQYIILLKFIYYKKEMSYKIQFYSALF